MLRRAVTTVRGRGGCSHVQPLSTATQSKPQEAAKAGLAFKDMLHGNPLNMPRVPIPNLKDTVDRWLKSVEPLAGVADMDRVRTVAHDFANKDGEELQKRLVERDQAVKGYPHSYIEQLWDDMYLEGRWALPINSNPYLALSPGPKDSEGSDPQIASAARFLSAWLRWAGGVRSGYLQPSSPPLCVHQYPLQAGTGRIAEQRRDTVYSNPDSRHVVAVCNNKFYRINVLSQDGSRQISEEALSSQLERVRGMAARNKEPERFVGYLTAIGRDEWAAQRTALEKHHAINRASLEAIDSALIVVGLDTDDTNGPNEEGRAYLTGKGGKSRWFDKHMAVVLKNGKLALNFEHSYSDGMCWTRMLGEVWHGMHGLPPPKNQQPLPPRGPTFQNASPPEELKWNIPDGVMAEISKARSSFQKDIANCPLEVLDYDKFGKNKCKEWKLSPDAAVQVSLQMAYYRLHGSMPPVYESCSTTSFFHGRTETIRSCTAESAHFVQLMKGGGNKDGKKAALMAAAKKHVAVAKEAQACMGVDRHLTALQSIANRDAPFLGGAFFTDPMYGRSKTWLLSTSNLSYPYYYQFGFGPVVAEGYGLGYLVQNEGINLVVTNFVSSNKTNSTAFRDAVSTSLTELCDLYS